MKFFIYCLFRPGEHKPCYVGVTCRPDRRKINHTHRYGKGVTLIVWETFNNVPEVALREIELIEEFKALGIKLDNIGGAPYRGVKVPLDN